MVKLPKFLDLIHGKEKVIPRSQTKWSELGADKAFWLFVVFSVVVFLMGGGSRYDIVSVGPLRFVAAIVLAISIWFQTAESFRKVRVPVLLILLMGIWMALQLIPLPFSWWTQLPQRETIAAADAAMGLGEIARPITLSPLRTWNSISSLVVPLAGLLLLALLDEEGWSRVLWIVFVAGVVSAILGFAQVIVGNASGLYLYKITNSDSAVGLFSNRNHNALFLNISLVFGLFKLHELLQSKQKSRLLLIATFLLLIALGIVINASRFGIALLAVVSLAYAALLIVRSRQSAVGRKKKGQIILLGLTGATMGIGLIALLWAAGRIPALERLLEADDRAEARAETLPLLGDMLFDHQPFGLGFGSFEQGYRMIEPLDQLSPFYLNQAHFDWLQIGIEGGLPALAILALGLAWIGLQIWRRIKYRSETAAAKSYFWLGIAVLAMIAAHSLADYPLRTPIIMLVAVIAIVMLGRDRAGNRGD